MAIEPSKLSVEDSARIIRQEAERRAVVLAAGVLADRRLDQSDVRIIMRLLKLAEKLQAHVDEVRHNHPELRGIGKP